MDLKLDEERVLGGGGGVATHGLFLPIFLTMKMIFNPYQFCHGVRQYQGESVKKIHDNIIKDNVTVRSSNFSQNDRMIRISTHFLAKNHSKLPIADKNLIL